MYPTSGFKKSCIAAMSMQTNYIDNIFHVSNDNRLTPPILAANAVAYFTFAKKKMIILRFANDMVQDFTTSI